MWTLVAVTVLSTLLAVGMSIVAWRVSREERRRSDARVSALADDIFDSASASWDADTALFTSARGPAASRWGLSLVAGVFAIATAAAVVVIFSGESRIASAGTRRPVASVPARPRVAVALELVELGHERDGDRLTVRGVVRNPAGGAEVDRLDAVVLLFDREGTLLTTARAAIEAAALGPGGESSFVVNIAGAANVSRYRVSFRTEDQVVPHVDRRPIN
jgi:hypothetical protein